MPAVQEEHTGVREVLSGSMSDEAQRLGLSIVLGALAVCRLDARATLPDWLPRTGFCSVTRTPDELSIVCRSDAVPDGVRHDGPWRALVVDGPLDFAMVGVLHALLAPLAAADVPVFAMSTFDTDFVLVREGDLDRSVHVLRDAGHAVRE